MTEIDKRELVLRLQQLHRKMKATSLAGFLRDQVCEELEISAQTYFRRINGANVKLKVVEAERLEKVMDTIRDRLSQKMIDNGI